MTVNIQPIGCKGKECEFAEVVQVWDEDGNSWETIRCNYPFKIIETTDTDIPEICPLLEIMGVTE